VRDGAVTLNAVQLRLLFTGMDWTRLGAVPVPTEKSGAAAPKN